MHPHLFRHLAATLQLRQDPRAHEQVSRSLGHRSPETAYLYYCDGETQAALEQFDQMILGLKAELSPPSSKAGRRDHR